ncbi:signal peptidase I [Sphingomonas sp. 1P06PA]|uniref:signal peptidase I n=1 Tax=Sphingomonas sp. 1P06PA TaxID=554121 RepID=UPI0039A6D636
MPPEATPEPAVTPAAAQPEAKGTDWWAEIKGVFWLVLAVLGFHSFLAKPFYIPSELMMPVLIKGDRLVVTKYPYGWSYVSPSFHLLPFMQGRLFGSLPERGDIAIVTPTGQSSDYIKRVIGLPGDRLSLVAGQVILNGKPVPRVRMPDIRLPVDANLPCNSGRQEGHRITGDDGKLYCSLPIYRETLPNGRSYDTIDLAYIATVDDFPEITIPANHVFLMGDNRDESADSRVASEYLGLGGPVPWENLGGRAEFITFSLDGTSEIWNPLSWFTAMRGGRAGTSLHPARGPAPK